MLSNGIGRLSPRTNRETFSLFWRCKDDVTGELVNIAGIIGTPQTIAHWVVRAGQSVITDTVTPLVIPQFPFSSDLLAVTFTVPPALAINAGSSISLTSLDGVNSMAGYVTSYNAVTGVVVAQISCSFQFEIREVAPERDIYDGYTSFPSQGIGTVTNRAPLITASLDDDRIMFVDQFTIDIEIPETVMRQLWNQTFQAALTVSDGSITRQPLLADLPIFGGGVSR